MTRLRKMMLEELERRRTRRSCIQSVSLDGLYHPRQEKRDLTLESLPNCLKVKTTCNQPGRTSGAFSKQQPSRGGEQGGK